MSKFFTINGQKYRAKEFDFNTVCDLEDNGVSLQDMTKKPMSMARAYFALCLNGDKEKPEKRSRHISRLAETLMNYIQ